jgi:hypothetical protein
VALKAKIGALQNYKLFNILNVAILWDIAPSSPYENRNFGGTYHFHLQVRKSADQETSVYQVPNHLKDAGFLLG